MRELRQNASRYLRRVAAGESITVTDRGRPVAMLVPPPRHADTYEELVARGELIPGRGGPLPRPLPPGDGPALSEVLQRMRDEERW